MSPMELKALELSDLAEELDLWPSRTDPTVVFNGRERVATLAIQDHGLDSLIIVCDDDAVQADQVESVLDFMQTIYGQGTVNGKPCFPILN